MVRPAESAALGFHHCNARRGNWRNILFACAALLAITGCMTAEDRHMRVTVDLSSEMGPPKYRASGFLNAFSMDGKHPSDDMVVPLRIQLVRTGNLHTWGQADRMKALGIKQQLIITGWGSGVDKEHPGDNGNWKRWEDLVADWVRKTKARGIRVQWDLWNEPDYEYFWRRSQEQFDEAWKRAYRVIRRLDPEAPIVGPSWSGVTKVGSERFVNFLKFCKRNQVVPDYFTWHFPKDIVKETQYCRKLFRELGLNVKGLMVTEYGRKEEMYSGRIAWLITQIERARLDASCRANWGDGHLGGVFVDARKGLRKGQWWVYQRYADITGMLVTTEPGRYIDLVAGKDKKRRVVQVLLGNKGSAAVTSDGTFRHSPGSGPDGSGAAVGDVAVRFTGLEKTPWLIAGGRVHVVVERIPENEGKAVTGPVVVTESDVRVRGDSITIGIAWTDERDAFVVRLTPPRSGS